MCGNMADGKPAATETSLGLTCEEMWDVARALVPGITWERFLADWFGIQAQKQRKRLH